MRWFLALAIASLLWISYAIAQNVPPASPSSPTFLASSPVATPVLDRRFPAAKGLLSMWLALPGTIGGNQWYDVAMARHLTLQGMTTPVTTGWGSTTRPGGYADLAFDGNAAAATRTDSAYSFGAGAFSLMLWAFIPNITPEAGLITKGVDSGINEEFLLRLNGTSHLTMIIANPDESAYIYCDVTMTTALYQAQWVHIAFTYDGSSTTGGMKMYRNGVLAPSSPSSAGTFTGMTAGPRPLSVGSYDGARFLNGSLDDVRIYTRNLSAAEVYAFYVQSALGNPGLIRRLSPASAVVPSPVSAPALPGRMLPFFRPPKQNR